VERTIRLRTHLPYKPEHVWLALTNAQWLGKWFMENDIQPLHNHEFTFRMAPQKGWDGITYCKILKVDPIRYIEYTYQGQASGEKTLSCAGVHSDMVDKAAKGIFTKLDTTLSFTLTPICGGTTLTMQHSGYRGLKLIIISYVMQMGWKKQLHKKLPKVLQQIEESTSTAKKLLAGNK
jgi:uncharacterized protein YndB with AHSA1/START domain